MTVALAPSGLGPGDQGGGAAGATVGGPATVVRHVHRVMGTVVSFELRPDDCGPDVFVALAKSCARLDRADAVFSTYKANSPMSLLRRGALSREKAPPEMAEVLELCATARRASAGSFDPWKMPGGVDPTGLVKGWAADKALAVLRESGVGSALVNAGGDLVGFGGPEPGQPWRIGVRDPFSPGAVACVVESPGAVATSGCYERGEHVIDPRTGAPATAGVSATVAGPQLWLADALVTGLLVAGEVGLGWLDAVEGYEGYVISPDGSAAMTRGFPIAR